MDWFWIALIGLAIVGWFSKAADKEKAKKNALAEIALRKERAEAARAAILASGNREAIERLHLMEAAYQPGPAGAATAAPARGPGMLGTAAAVAGGMMVGNTISGAMQSAEMEAAFADLQAGLDTTDPASLASLAADMPDLGDEDFDIET